MLLLWRLQDDINVFDSSVEERSLTYGSSHSLQGQEFPHLINELSAPSIEEADSVVTVEEPVPHEVK